ncbi:hypothetical protein U5801_25860 [Lamprobacter modestohalophilus]|uniref:hypothetical protein n=1 Tax=Lamprobacter modestohalophilus TaxID=1064514 RepID=UPI002ADEB88D|nr:hypothetical protein [Lamprobacter modestohalophilus]MEA1053207.1 hypothetical protein [Lamprobacter modestohalophilus]
MARSAAKKYASVDIVPAECAIEDALKRDPDAILKRLDPEQRLKGLDPEQRLKGLDPAVIEAWLAKQRRDH